MPNPSIILTATDQASPAIARVRGQLEDLVKSFGKFNVAGKLSLPLLGVSTAIVAIGAAVTNALHVVRWVDDLADAGSALGITVENMARYQQLAKEAGVENTALSQSFNTLAKNVEAARSGEKEQIELFRRLGITQKELKELNFDQILERVARAFTGFNAGTAKAALQLEALGKSGAKTDDMLKKIASGVERQVGLTDEFIKNAQDMQDGLDKLSVAWQRFSVILAGPVVNALVSVSKALGLIGRSNTEELAVLTRELAQEEAIFKNLSRDTTGNVQEKTLRQSEERVRKLKSDIEQIRLALRRDVRESEPKPEPPAKVDTSAVEAERKRIADLLKLDRKGLLEGIDAQIEEYERGLIEIAKLERQQLAEREAWNDRMLKADMERIEETIRAERAWAEAVKEFQATRVREVEARVDQLTNLTESFFLKLQDFSGTDVFKTLGKDLYNLAYRMLILEPILARIKRALMDMAEGVDFGSTGTGFVGMLMKLFGLTGLKTSPTQLGGPGFDFSALGGSVGAMSPRVVGEAGPELFIPTKPGYIVPNHKMGAGMGVTVVNNNYVDSRSDQGSIAAMLEANRVSTIQSVRDLLTRRSPILRT